MERTLVEKTIGSIVLDDQNTAIEKKVVLFIDDNLDALELLSLFFEDDFEIITAPGGKEALELLSEMPPPDLILLDIHMVGMSGPKFLLELEKQRPDLIENVPVVFLTGMEMVPASKAVGFIRKPYDLDLLKVNMHGFIGMGSDTRRKISNSLSESAISTMLLS